MRTQIKKIVFDSSFERDFKNYKKKLSDGELDRLRDKLRIFKQDPFNPKLRTHKLKGRLRDYWAFSISYSDRIIFRFLDKETVFFIDIGGHDIYNY